MSVLRTLRKLVLGDTWVLPGGLAAVVLAAASWPGRCSAAPGRPSAASSCSPASSACCGSPSATGPIRRAPGAARTETLADRHRRTRPPAGSTSPCA